MTIVRTDGQEIDILLNRSIDTIYPGKEELRKALISGKQLTVYAGADATGNFLHLGHAINYMILRRFHKLGHKVVVLIGDFTAMIGDPTDKSSVRIRLTKEQVLENLKDFKNQVGKILDFDDTENPIKFRFNSEWLSKLGFEDIVNLASNFTVQNMIERETFQRRIREEKPLYMHEFMYPLMQGYDSVAMDVDVEIGGTDQTFNMLAGRTLVKRYLNKEKFVMTHPLLENPETGEILMSKSKGTGIALNDSANDMYGKTMAIPDPGLMLMFEHCTELSFEELADIRKEVEIDPYSAKKRLAREIVKMYHGEEKSLEAEKNFIATFKKGEIPEDAMEVSVNEGILFGEVLVREGLIQSKTEFRRLVDQKAITRMDTDETITSYDYLLEKDSIFKIGKKRFIKIKIK